MAINREDKYCTAGKINKQKRSAAWEVASKSFVEAKALGVHTDVYEVTDAHDVMEGGTQYVFAWLKN